MAGGDLAPLSRRDCGLTGYLLRKKSKKLMLCTFAHIHCNNSLNSVVKMSAIFAPYLRV
jgi:hypothetical protein